MQMHMPCTKKKKKKDSRRHCSVAGRLKGAWVKPANMATHNDALLFTLHISFDRVSQITSENGLSNGTKGTYKPVQTCV